MQGGNVPVLSVFFSLHPFVLRCPEVGLLLFPLVVVVVSKDGVEDFAADSTTRTRWEQ